VQREDICFHRVLAAFAAYYAPPFFGHGLGPTLPADRSTFAAYGGHVLGDVRRNCGAATGRSL